MNYDENYQVNIEEQPLETTNKPKIFTIINYVLTGLFGLFFLLIMYIGLAGIIEQINYAPDPNSTVNIEPIGLIFVIYLVYGGISAVCDLVGIIVSAINLKFDKPHARINLFINLGYLVLTLLIFVIMYLMVLNI